MIIPASINTPCFAQWKKHKLKCKSVRGVKFSKVSDQVSPQDLQSNFKLT